MKKKDGSLRIIRRDEHIDREDLGKEHPFGDSGQVIALILFLIIWILDSFVFRFSTILTNFVPIYLRLILAALFFIPAVYLARSGLSIVFKEQRDPPQVIDSGVFSLTRHPIYLSALLVYVGFVCITSSLISLLFSAVIFFFYDYISTYEENRLEEKFGQEYINYKKQTPKWLPRLSSKTAC